VHQGCDLRRFALAVLCFKERISVAVDGVAVGFISIFQSQLLSLNSRFLCLSDVIASTQNNEAGEGNSSDGDSAADHTRKRNAGLAITFFVLVLWPGATIFRPIQFLPHVGGTVLS